MADAGPGIIIAVSADWLTRSKFGAKADLSFKQPFCFLHKYDSESQPRAHELGDGVQANGSHVFTGRYASFWYVLKSDFRRRKANTCIGKDTEHIFQELDVIRRKQIDLARDHISLESMSDLP